MYTYVDPNEIRTGIIYHTYEQWVERKVDLKYMEARLKIVHLEYYKSYDDQEIDSIKESCSRGDIAIFLGVIAKPVATCELATFFEGLIAHLRKHNDSPNQEQEKGMEHSHDQEQSIEMHSDHYQAKNKAMDGDPDKKNIFKVLLIDITSNCLICFWLYLLKIPSYVKNMIITCDRWLSEKKSDLSS